MYNIIVFLKQYLKNNFKLNIINLLFFVLGLIGFLMLISGILQLISIYLTPWQSIVFGIFIIWISFFLIIYFTNTNDIKQIDNVSDLYYDDKDKENNYTNNIHNHSILENQINLANKDDKIVLKNTNKNFSKKNKFQKIKIIS